MCGGAFSPFAPSPQLRHGMMSEFWRVIFSIVSSHLEMWLNLQLYEYLFSVDCISPTRYFETPYNGAPILERSAFTG